MVSVLIGNVVMETLLRNIGNSKGFVVPSPIIKALGIEVGDKLSLSAIDGTLLVTPALERTKLKLSDLITKCDPSAPMPADLECWDAATSVGNEI